MSPLPLPLISFVLRFIVSLDKNTLMWSSSPELLNQGSHSVHLMNIIICSTTSTLRNENKIWGMGIT